MPIQTPFGLYSPEMLAQMAQAAFKAPQPMQMPGMGQPPQGGQGFNVAKGIGALGEAAGDMMSGWQPSSVTPKEGTSLGGGAAGGMTTMGPGGQYSVTGLGGDTAPMPTSTTVSDPSGGPLTMKEFWSGKWLPTLGFGGGGYGGGGQGGGGGFYP